jgi:hypothetical protein
MALGHRREVPNTVNRDGGHIAHARTVPWLGERRADFSPGGRMRRSSMNADAEILARVRALGPIYRTEPGGTRVLIIGLEEMGDLWPPDVR